VNSTLIIKPELGHILLEPEDHLAGGTYRRTEDHGATWKNVRVTPSHRWFEKSVGRICAGRPGRALAVLPDIFTTIKQKAHHIRGRKKIHLLSLGSLCYPTPKELASIFKRK
jgi:hypothetical protein